MGRRGRRVPKYLHDDVARREAAQQSRSARPWRYASAIEVDESQCVAADPEKQHYSVVSVPVYYSMKLGCERCGEEFWFSANEQRVWYEEWGFWIDSVPKHCAGCRKRLREADSSPEARP